ncbi:hypothetical protein PG996_007994 [Apiospora saccharicola]|uniref:Uncharacterized protein n=1 Tax=Apiospora saccharicola TaxID=335842 RepID=A0ABR1UWQ0_9PEZI
MFGDPISSWAFTRAQYHTLQQPHFQPDLRRIAGQQEDFKLPWDDNMYLTFPSAEKPDWKALSTHVERLNAGSDNNTHYKIVYIMRRAHKVSTDPSQLDPSDIDPELTDLGKEQCETLQTSFKRAMENHSLPPPGVIATSPLARALQTTQRGIVPLFPSVRPVVLEGLREQVTNHGKNQRHDKRWIEERFPDFDVQKVDAVDRLGERYSIPGSKEPYQDVWQRVRASLTFLFENYERESVLLLMIHCHVTETLQREIDGWGIPEERRKEVEFFVGEAKGYAMVTSKLASPSSAAGNSVALHVRKKSALSGDPTTPPPSGTPVASVDTP